MTATTAKATRPMTTRQKSILRAFVRLNAEGQCPPTLREMSRAMGSKHHHSLCSQLDSLTVKGWLMCLPKTARCYRLAPWLAGKTTAEVMLLIDDAPTAERKVTR